jgi:hypothetical protein
MQTRRHVLIGGTGRAGTTFVVQLLTELGLHTGFDRNDIRLYMPARAGLERALADADAPYFVKQPTLAARELDRLLCGRVLGLDHAILPMRSFAAVAKSRGYVQKCATGVATANGHDVPGGLWHAHDEAEQLRVLQIEFAELMDVVTRHRVKTLFPRYPDLIRDPRYLFDQLTPTLGGVTFDAFAAAHRAVARPEWVNSFTPDDR